MDPLLILLFCYELNLSHTRQFAADLLDGKKSFLYAILPKNSRSAQSVQVFRSSQLNPRGSASRTILFQLVK